MENFEFEKAKAFIIVEILGYIPNSIVIKTILKKITGNVSAISCDSGETLPERSSPFDRFIQVLDGKAEILINEELYILETGQCIVIPAHSINIIKGKVKFKLLSTVIKSGYED